MALCGGSASVITAVTYAWHVIGRAIWACEGRRMRREVNDHPKALFRRATANAALLNYEAAMADFTLCKAVSSALAKDVDR